MTEFQLVCGQNHKAPQVSIILSGNVVARSDRTEQGSITRKQYLLLFCTLSIRIPSEIKFPPGPVLLWSSQALDCR